MRNRILFALIVLALLPAACRPESNVLDSRNLPEAERIPALARFITLKSEPIEARFKLFNVNMNERSVPGASGADYKIYLKISPRDVVDWTRGREKFLTSQPQSRDWAADILDPAELDRLAVLDFDAFAEETPGYTYQLWANADRGIVLIRYIAR